MSYEAPYEDIYQEVWQGRQKLANGRKVLAYSVFFSLQSDSEQRKGIPPPFLALERWKSRLPSKGADHAQPEGSILVSLSPPAP